ncbi:MAG: Calx-beta domain-containing protein, partial [Pseudoxanthomonas sp.]
LVVTFTYDDESDGNGVAFYPIPAQAISQAHWVEGGAPGNVDQRGSSDRHLLMIDCTNRHLYELYNVYYNPSQNRWYAGSGAFFDLNTNGRRPEGWTSADASGLAIFPGLVRYDEAANTAVPEIKHALRVTLRASNGHVYPASHSAGSTSGALPMGARLRLKTNVGGVDPATRTSDPTSRKIFRAMQKYGLIMVDNGSDLYISGTFDVRWNNGTLNPAFATLKASDFEVIQLGWKPAASTASLSAVSASPNPVTGGQAATGTVTLTSAAPSGGARVTLSSASSAFSVPASVTVAQGASSASFAIATTVSATAASGTLSATYAGVTRTSTLTVNPPAAATALSAVSASPNPVTGGQAATGTVTLTAAAPSGGVQVALSSGSGAFSVPASVSVAQGASSATFPISTTASTTTVSGTLSATYAGVTRTSTLTVNATPLTLSIGDASVIEGASGTRAMTFTVSLSRPSSTAVTYSIATANRTATAGSDYVARSLAGESIAAGQTSRTFAVTINGDRQREPNETFAVNVSGISGATAGDVQATGTIVSDDKRLMSSPAPASPGTGSTAQASQPARAAPAPTSGTACLTPSGAVRCLQQIPARWLQAWERLSEQPAK